MKFRKLTAIASALAVLGSVFTALPITASAETESGSGFTLATSSAAAPIYVDSTGADYDGLSIIAEAFAGDVNLVSGQTPSVKTESNASGISGAVIAGVVGDDLITSTGIDTSGISSKNEVYTIQKIGGNLVIAGSDKRGAIYGLFHISEAIGVSPWVYWADAKPATRTTVSYDPGTNGYTSSEPSVKYRGIFLNDEDPNLTSWTKNQFGECFGPQFYDKVFELILRLKGNYLWPAMWSNEFYKEGNKGDANLDTFKEKRGLTKESTNATQSKLANAELADKYGIVMGTSHHEPIGRAGNEWAQEMNTYLQNKGYSDAVGKTSSETWNFNDYPEALKAFWTDSYARSATYDNLLTIGMRGEADSELPGGLQPNIDNLKNVIKAQFDIMDTYNSAHSIANRPPTMLALYKEVEEFWLGKKAQKSGINYVKDANGNIQYDTSEDTLKKWALEGDGKDLMKDTIILLTNDNFGNVRTLPDPTTNESENFGGWGMYYHFDYMGGPRSYRWVSSVQLEKIWQNMTDCYKYGVDDMWIVNVGDLKPHEMEISYFLDLAYDYDKWDDVNKIDDYTKAWSKQQFAGQSDETINAIAQLESDYLKLNGTRRAEIVFPDTYSLTDSNELYDVIARAEDIYTRATALGKTLQSTSLYDAYYQLVEYPAAASANVTLLNAYSALSKMFSDSGSLLANTYAQKVQECIDINTSMMAKYNTGIANGKWNGMQSNTGLTNIGAKDYALKSSAASIPKQYYVNPVDDATLIVNADGTKTGAKAGGTLTLPAFTSTNKEAYAITVSNGGKEALSYTATANADWIKLSKPSAGSNGDAVGSITSSVYSGEVLCVTIDWSKLSETSTGTITITSGSQSVTVNVTAEVVDTTNLSDGTFIGKDGTISIEAEHYTASNGMMVVDNLGKNLSTIKAEDYTTTYAPTDTNAPYAQYKVYIPEAKDYMITAITGPGNPRLTTDTLSYAIKVDNGEAQSISSVPDEYIAGDSDNNGWKYGVMQHSHTAWQKVNLTAGEHTIAFYPSNSAIVLQKLVITPYDSSDTTKDVYSRTLNGAYMQRDGEKDAGDEFIGPDESYRKGQTIAQKTLVHPLISEDIMTVPGKISESGKTVIVTETGKYEVITTGASGDLTLALGGNNVTLENNGEGTYLADLTQGTYTLTFVGAALLEFKVFNIEPGYVINHPMSTAAEVNVVASGYENRTASASNRAVSYDGGAMKYSTNSYNSGGFKYDITSLVKYVLKNVSSDATFTLRMEVKATADDTKSPKMGFMDGNGNDIQSLDIKGKFSSSEYTALILKNVDLKTTINSGGKVYFYLTTGQNNEWVRNVTVTYPTSQENVLFTHTSASDWTNYEVYDSTNAGGTLTKSGDALTGSYTNSWNTKNGVKLDVTDYVKSFSGGKFGITVNTGNLYWGSNGYNDVAARLENADSTVLATLASGNPGQDSGYTLTGEASYAYKAADGTVYLCITHPCGYQTYNDITFWGYEVSEPKFATNIFVHTFNKDSAELSEYTAYESGDTTAVGKGNSAVLKYDKATTSSASTCGVKINVTSYINKILAANPGMTIGASMLIKPTSSSSWGSNYAKISFEKADGTSIASTKATSSDVVVGDAVTSDSNTLEKGWSTTPISVETDKIDADDTVYLCITSNSGTIYIDDVTLFWYPDDDSVIPSDDEEPTATPTPTPTPTAEPTDTEDNGGVVINDTLTSGNVPAYYSTVTGKKLVINSNWLKVMVNNISSEVTSGDDAYTIDISAAAAANGMTIKKGGKLDISFDFSNGNGSSLTGVNVYLGSGTDHLVGSIDEFAGSSGDAFRTFTGTADVTATGSDDLKLRLNLTGKTAKVQLKNVKVTYRTLYSDITDETPTITEEYDGADATVPSGTTVTIGDGGSIKNGTLTASSGTFTVVVDGSTISGASSVQFDTNGKVTPSDGAIISTPNQTDSSKTDNGFFITKKLDSATETTFKINNKEFKAQIGEGSWSGDVLFGIFITGIPSGETVTVTAE